MSGEHAGVPRASISQAIALIMPFSTRFEGANCMPGDQDDGKPNSNKKPTYWFPEV